jgi:hypothetical protein
VPTVAGRAGRTWALRMVPLIQCVSPTCCRPASPASFTASALCPSRPGKRWPLAGLASVFTSLPSPGWSLVARSVGCGAVLGAGPAIGRKEGSGRGEAKVAWHPEHKSVQGPPAPKRSKKHKHPHHHRACPATKKTTPHV